MDEKRVSKAEVTLALWRNSDHGAVLDDLFPPPSPSEYEKAIDNLNLMDDGHRRELWNAAIKAADSRLCQIGLNAPANEIRKLKV